MKKGQRQHVSITLENQMIPNIYENSCNWLNTSEDFPPIGLSYNDVALTHWHRWHLWKLLRLLGSGLSFAQLPSLSHATFCVRICHEFHV